MVLEQIANLSVLNKGFSVRVRVTPPNFNGNMNIKKFFLKISDIFKVNLRKCG